MRRLVYFFALLAMLRVASETVGAEADLGAKITALAQPLIDDGEVVGLAIGVVQEGKTQFFFFGETRRGSGTRPDADTVYEIGSISKVFTGILLADMIERKLVAADDPVERHLPDGVRMPIFDGKPITLEHLSTHTSGLPRMPGNFVPADRQNPYADYTAEQLYEFLAKFKPARPPGKRAYSNLGVGLLGHVLARRAESDYETLLAERITGPLKLSDTRVRLTDEMRPRLAPPYDANLKPNHNWDIPTLAGAGGIRSTPRDMLKFVEACLAADETPLGRALKSSFAKRHTTDDGPSIGLGWFIARDGVTRLHAGMTGGYSSWLAVVPGRGIGAVVLSNTAASETAELGEQVTQLAFGLDVKPKPRRREVQVDSAVLAGYVGTYRLAPKFALTVTLDAGRLMVQGTGQPNLPVYAESPTKFFSKAVDAQVTFVPGADGRIEKLVLHQFGVDQEAVREEAKKE